MPDTPMRKVRQNLKGLNMYISCVPKFYIQTDFRHIRFEHNVASHCFDAGENR
jgi:hypothetical protein